MKICLDLRTASNGRHGIARYGTELTKALQALDTSHRLLLLTRQGNEFEDLRQAGTSVHRCSARPYSLEEQLLVPLTVARLQPDIYHCLTYACPLFVPCPTLFNIYDLLPLERPQEFSRGLRLYYRGFVRWSAKRAQRIVTASSYTSSSICERLPVPSHKVHVISAGGDHVRELPVSDRDERAYREINPRDLDYFLSVGNPRPHKNMLFSIRCFLQSKSMRQRRVRYVLVGEQHPSVYDYVESRDREGQIHLAGEVSEGLLCLLYERAIALLCPSLGEGFCLPVAEAMQFGLPVIAANEGALPEVLGHTGILLPLDSVPRWQEAFESVHTSRKQGSWNPSSVVERAGQFSWQKAARQTMDLYEEIHREKQLSDG
jgi:glycosyltransferase involved in cell wall biosynthesis